MAAPSTRGSGRAQPAGGRPDLQAPRSAPAPPVPDGTGLLRPSLRSGSGPTEPPADGGTSKPRDPKEDPMDASAATHTHLLGTYTVEGRERQVLALVTDEPDVMQMVDVLARPIDDDDDARRVEDRITCLGECQSIADDYIALAIELGAPPMPDAWW